MKKTTLSLAVAAVLALALTGCASIPGPSSSDEAPSGTNRPSTSTTSTSPASGPEEDVADAEEAAGDEPVDDILEFGQTRTYEDGTSLTVSAPKQVKPGPWAYPEGLSEASVFTVTIVNGSDAALDANSAYATVQSGNTESEEVYDDNYSGPPETSILPGREATFKVMFATADPADIVFQMAPTWDHHEAIFTNTN